MGLDTGFKLRIKNGLEDKDIKTKQQYRQSYIELLFFGRPSTSTDDLIKSISTEKEKICFIGVSENNKNKGKLVFDTVKYEKPDFPECEFVVDQNQLKQLLNKIKPLAKIMAKYSDRVQADLFNDFDDKEISKQDKTQIKDLLYEIDEYASYEDLYFLIKLHNFFTQFFASEINSDFGIKADLIYWRNY